MLALVHNGSRKHVKERRERDSFSVRHEAEVHGSRQEQDAVHTQDSGARPRQEMTEHMPTLAIDRYGAVQHAWLSATCGGRCVQHECTGRPMLATARVAVIGDVFPRVQRG